MGQEQARTVRGGDEAGDCRPAQAVHHQGGHRHEGPQARILHRRWVYLKIV